jgi:KRAB domain-containing zinc finger protein
VERAHIFENHPCEVCGKIYKTKDYLVNHVRAIHEPRRYVCDFPGCDKKFPVSNKLKIHRKIHTNNRDAVCKTCGMVSVLHQKLFD